MGIWRWDVVERLLKCEGVYINHANKVGWTVLMYTSNNGHANIVQLLLAQPSIDINFPDSHGWTALTLGVDEGQTDVVRLLLAHKDIDIQASKVADVEFWKSIPEEVKPARKHLTLPEDVLEQVGIKWRESDSIEDIVGRNEAFD
jgi:ankyrin repeat protein